jgi:hypothetical protein
MCRCGILGLRNYHSAAILELSRYILAILNTNILLDFLHRDAHLVCSTMTTVFEHMAFELFT